MYTSNKFYKSSKGTSDKLASARRASTKQDSGFWSGLTVQKKHSYFQSGSKYAQPVQRVRVYRMGSRTDKNLCPRDPQDTNEKSEGRGLSTSSHKPDTNAQVIETDLLQNPLVAVNDHGNHYAIRPDPDHNNALLEGWAATRDNGGHQYTGFVRDAIVGTIKKKKKKKKKKKNGN